MVFEQGQSGGGALHAVTYPPGFWGAHDSLHTFCEPSYTTTFYAAEPYNALGSIVYAVVGVLNLRRLHGIGQPLVWRATAGWWSLVIVGFGSFWFHVTMRYHMELLDEIPASGIDSKLGLQRNCRRRPHRTLTGSTEPHLLRFSLLVDAHPRRVRLPPGDRGHLRLVACMETIAGSPPILSPTPNPLDVRRALADLGRAPLGAEVPLSRPRLARCRARRRPRAAHRRLP